MDKSLVAPVRGIEVKEKRNKGKLVSWIFVISFVVLTSGYTVYWYFYQYPGILEENEQEAIRLNNTLLAMGAQFGYEQAVAQVFEEAIKCEPVPVKLNNQTINVIAIECFQQ